MTESTPEIESLVGLLNQLVEVDAPVPVSMMPQTPGWMVLAVVIAVALIWGARRVLLWRRATAYRRAALRELALVGDRSVDVARILKRVALVAYPRNRVAALSGDIWLRFLDKTGGDGLEDGGFENGVGAVLGTAAYVQTAKSGSVSEYAANSDGLNALACQWVRQHSQGARP